jgi:hypothetical protein
MSLRGYLGTNNRIAGRNLIGALLCKLEPEQSCLGAPLTWTPDAFTICQESYLVDRM